MPLDPIIFLPGLLCDERIWSEQARALAPAPTLIADLTRDESVGAMAARVLADAPQRFSLVAVSMGGYVAFELFRRAPERIARLALFDTRAGAETAAGASRRRAEVDSLQIGRFAGVTTRLLPRLVAAQHVEGPVGAELQQMARRVGGEAFIRQQRAILDRPDSRPTLSEITIPTLVAVGEHDVLTPPADALEIHLGIRSSRFIVIRDCGHLPPLEEPAQTGVLLRQFLS